ncbi:hypothetical protein CDL15_Pgr000976 [Punica granatum]|uniref:UDP-glycosyltransferases domain-containing protein n=1 Tax=Punica granatum TaxID=22663 RepID=A0A218XII9_PUNGR|nr:hypothetical protein CDL15_Pgr000976 [Punica granatum]
MPLGTLFICLALEWIFGVQYWLSSDDRANYRKIEPSMWYTGNAGFEERTRSHGKIVLWAPQNRVLWHRSVGAHVTHGGYNSVFECVAGEVPMICRPLWGDNKINGVVLEEWGIAVTIDGGTITKDGMLKCLEMVMEGGEVGKTMRQKIRDLKVLVMDAAGPNGSASRYFNKLVDIISS